MHNLTESQRTRITYAHFTLEEWELMAQCVRDQQALLATAKYPLNTTMVTTMLSKFPSAAL